VATDILGIIYDEETAERNYTFAPKSIILPVRIKVMDKSAAEILDVIHDEPQAQE